MEEREGFYTPKNTASPDKINRALDVSTRDARAHASGFNLVEHEIVRWD